MYNHIKIHIFYAELRIRKHLKNDINQLAHEYE
jgi:hypothetical protein